MLTAGSIPKYGRRLRQCGLRSVCRLAVMRRMNYVKRRKHWIALWISGTAESIVPKLLLRAARRFDWRRPRSNSQRIAPFRLAWRRKVRGEEKANPEGAPRGKQSIKEREHYV